MSTQIKNILDILPKLLYDTSDIDAEINNIEANILEFVSNLNTHQLKSIIYMSLDMDVKIGHPDKLMADKL